MSNCKIKIKINDQEIILDPNSDISADDMVSLIANLDTFTARKLYQSIKGSVDFDSIIKTDNLEEIEGGRIIYEALIKNALENQEFITPAASIMLYDTIEGRIMKKLDHTKRLDLSFEERTLLDGIRNKPLLKAFINSLNDNVILESGNFVENMREAYKQSPQSINDIRSTFFVGEPNKRALFNHLVSMPGMETVKIAVGVTNNQTAITGRYISPDNIVQILVPNNLKFVINTTQGATSKVEVLPKSKAVIRDVILHELVHSVFTEFYKSDSTFRREMKAVYETFLKGLKEQSPKSLGINDKSVNNLLEKYTDIQEFIADAFINNNIITALSNIKVTATDAPVESALYDYFIQRLGKKLEVDNTLLDEIIKKYSTGKISEPIYNLSTELKELTGNDEFRNMFYNGGEDEDVVEDSISARTEYDTLGSTSAKADVIQKFFVKSFKDGVFLKDAYYKSMEDPNDYKLSKLYEKDLVLVPWVRYVKAIKQTTTEKGVPGYWQERGVLVNSETKKPILKSEKLQIVDVMRDEKGDIIQNVEGGLIEKRNNYAPVVYSNRKKGTVVIAKLGETKSNVMNTVSIPFKMVQGIRKYDRSYFDHTEDYASMLEQQLIIKSQLEDILKEGADNHTDTKLKEVEKIIVKLEKDLVRADELTQKNKALYEMYSFSVADGDYRNMNVPEADYIAANYTPDDMENRVFASEEDAAFRIFKTKAGKYFQQPNPKRFKIMFGEAQEIIKGFSKSEDYKTAVSEGDLVRFKIQDKENKDLDIWKWAPISKALANGIEIATKEGKGMIIPYSRIIGFAKNVHSEWFFDKVAIKLQKQTKAVTDLIYAKKGSDERETASETISYKSIKFNAKFNQKTEESEEDAIERFQTNFQMQVDRAVPYKTYVQVARSYERYDVVTKTRKSYDYNSTELILAKTSNSFLTVRYTSEGKMFIETVPFEKTEDSELIFLINDLTEVKEVWDEGLKEKELIQSNYLASISDDEDIKKEYIKNTGTKESAKYEFLIDARLDPKSFNDVYDFYDDITSKLSHVLKGDVIRIKPWSDDAKIKPYYRKVISVRDDGFVIVAEYNTEDRKLKSGFVIKKGYYSRAVDPKEIMSIGLKGYVPNELFDKDNEKEQNALNVRQDLFERRTKMFEKAKRDLDYNDFIFRKKQTGVKFNATIDKNNSKTGWYPYFIPFTAKILDKTSEEETFLNQKLEAIVTDDIWIQSWMYNDTVNPIRGINANTTFFKAKDILNKTGRYYKLKSEIYNELKIGDWVITEYTNKAGVLKQFARAIERFDNGKIYVLNADMTTRAVNFNKILGIKVSIQNDKWSGFTRVEKIKDALKLKTKNGENVSEESINVAKNSLQAEYKSPNDSMRVLVEMGNRFKTLNPEVKINYLNSIELGAIYKHTGFNYADSRAFVLNGEVNINSDKASISDVIHEYAHLFLHGLKYDNYELYQTLISVTNTNPLFVKIANMYSHLEYEDLQEEVFVTVLGEYLRDNLKDKEWEGDNKEVFNQFSNYIGVKAKQLFNGNDRDPRELDAKEVLYMRLEDVITLVGDWVMNDKISNYSDYEPLDSNKNISKLKSDLMKSGFLTQQCNG